MGYPHDYGNPHTQEPWQGHYGIPQWHDCDEFFRGRWGNWRQFEWPSSCGRSLWFQLSMLNQCVKHLLTHDHGNLWMLRHMSHLTIRNILFREIDIQNQAELGRQLGMFTQDYPRNGLLRLSAHVPGSKLGSIAHLGGTVINPIFIGIFTLIWCGFPWNCMDDHTPFIPSNLTTKMLYVQPPKGQPHEDVFPTGLKPTHRSSFHRIWWCSSHVWLPEDTDTTWPPHPKLVQGL